MRTLLALLAATISTTLSGAATAQTPAAQPAPTPAPAAAQPPANAPDVKAGNDAAAAGDFEAAVRHYDAALAKGPIPATARLSYGFSLHQLKRLDEAMVQHKLVATASNREIRVDGLYNCACASALLGKPDDAIRYLTLAIDAGFADTDHLAKDTDLDSIREDARYKELVASIGKAPRLAQWMDHFLGTWVSTTPSGQVTENATYSRPTSASSAIVVSATYPSGAGWTGMIYPNASDRTWTWAHIDGLGTSLILTGERLDGGVMRFLGREQFPTGPGRHMRVTFTPGKDGSIEEVVEFSDDARSWKRAHAATMRKAEPNKAG